MASANLVVPDGAEALPEAKVKQLKQAFSLFDKDNDMAITQKDLITFMKSLGHELSELEVEDMVSECNKISGPLGEEGGSNYIEFKAFYTAVAAKLKADAAEQNKGAYAVRDARPTPRHGMHASRRTRRAATPASARRTYPANPCTHMSAPSPHAPPSPPPVPPPPAATQMPMRRQGRDGVCGPDPNVADL